MTSESDDTHGMIVAFEVLEDDLLPIVFKSSLPSYMSLRYLDGKIRFGHSYRNARETLFDKDPTVKLMFMAQSFLAAANQLPRELVRECVQLAIKDIEDKTVGVPHMQITNAEFLKDLRAREKSGKKQRSRKPNAT